MGGRRHEPPRRSCGLPPPSRRRICQPCIGSGGHICEWMWWNRGSCPGGGLGVCVCVCVRACHCARCPSRLNIAALSSHRPRSQLFAILRPHCGDTLLPLWDDAVARPRIATEARRWKALRDAGGTPGACHARRRRDHAPPTRQPRITALCAPPQASSSSFHQPHARRWHVRIGMHWLVRALSWCQRT